MIFIGNNIKVKTGIEQGCIYNFSPKDGVSNHYYMVLNKNPKTDDEIYLAPFTSKKEKILKFIEYAKLDRKTFVDIPDKECTFLPRPKEGGIDCSRPIEVTLTKLIQLIDESSGSCNYPKAGQTLIQRVIDGVKLSPMVKPVIKTSL